MKNLKIKIYKTVILPDVLYGCETWSFTLREEHRLRVFENRVLRRIFGPKREAERSWRKLHNDEIHSLYSSPNIVRVPKTRTLRWAGHVARMWEGRGVYRVLVGRPDGKRPLPEIEPRSSSPVTTHLPLAFVFSIRGSRVRFPTEAVNFSLHHRVQNGPGSHPASYPMGSRGSFPGGKAAGA
jgi:hypothetical protein